MVRKKICFFIGFYPLVKGGAEYQARIIADNLSDVADIFFISVSNLHEKPKVEIVDGYRVYQIPYLSKFNKVLLYYPLAFKINKILKDESPDTIYQRILNSFSYHLAKFTKIHKISYFIHIADKYSLIFDTSTISCFVRRWMFNCINNSNGKYITQTDEQTVLLGNLGIKPVLQVYNIHPIVDFDLSLARLKKLNVYKKKIVWIGNSRPVKRLKLFIDLADLLSGIEELEFIVIGRVDEESYINRMIGLKNLNYLGEKDNSVVNSFLENDIFLTVNTSVSEGFSNVFIQSWLKGVPVISLNSNPDSLFDNYNLGTFCDDHYNLIGDSIIAFLNDTGSYIRCSNECRKVAHELFTVEKSMEKIRKLL